MSPIDYGCATRIIIRFYLVSLIITDMPNYNKHPKASMLADDIIVYFTSPSPDNRQLKPRLDLRSVLVGKMEPMDPIKSL